MVSTTAVQLPSAKLPCVQVLQDLRQATTVHSPLSYLASPCAAYELQQLDIEMCLHTSTEILANSWASISIIMLFLQ